MAKNTQLKDKNRPLRESDIVILVTGLLGSGKSKFINTLLKEERMAVSETLVSVTTKIDYEIINPIPDVNFHGRRLVIVDTPGLNNKLIKDNKILRDIVDWVENSHVKEIGVIYLYDIFQQTYSSISEVDLAALRASFQDSKGVFKRVILVTTKWGRLGKSEGEARENELKATFWKDMIGGGSQVKRFDDSPSSAWQIVYVLLNHADKGTGFDVRSQLTKLRTHLKNASMESDTGKNIFSAIFQSIFGIFSWGASDKNRGTAKKKAGHSK